MASTWLRSLQTLLFIHSSLSFTATQWSKSMILPLTPNSIHCPQPRASQWSTPVGSSRIPTPHSQCCTKSRLQQPNLNTMNSASALLASAKSPFEEISEYINQIAPTTIHRQTREDIWTDDTTISPEKINTSQWNSADSNYDIGNNDGARCVVKSAMELVPPWMIHGNEERKGSDDTDGNFLSTAGNDVTYNLKDLDVTFHGIPSIQCAFGLPSSSDYYAASTESNTIDFLYDNEEEDWVRDARFQICSIFPNTNPTTSTNTEQEVMVRWNITFPPPQSTWLWALANSWPGVHPTPVSYQHLSGKPTSFSWKRIWNLFGDAFKIGELRVPLACIEGSTMLRFVLRDEDGGEVWKLALVVEGTSYADDLKRGALQNRHCAWDLRHFLETMRKPKDVPVGEWEQTVMERLSWESVPRMVNTMEIEPMDEEEGSSIAFAFLGVSMGLVGLFSLWMATELLGVSI